MISSIWKRKVIRDPKLCVIAASPITFLSVHGCFYWHACANKSKSETLGTLLPRIFTFWSAIPFRRCSPLSPVSSTVRSTFTANAQLLISFSPLLDFLSSKDFSVQPLVFIWLLERSSSLFRGLRTCPRLVLQGLTFAFIGTPVPIKAMAGGLKSKNGFSNWEFFDNLSSSTSVGNIPSSTSHQNKIVGRGDFHRSQMLQIRLRLNWRLNLGPVGLNSHYLWILGDNSDTAAVSLWVGFRLAL
jgi:hypothetical protein